MRYIAQIPGFLALGILLAVVFAAQGCKGVERLVSMPSIGAQASPVPAHHNIPATFAGHPEGPLMWLCATQPRQYVTPTGSSQYEEDHYLQYTPCPAVPIQ